MKRTSNVGLTRSEARTGVVLLVMLSLLALFTVIAVTFVVASGQFRRSATAFSRVEQYGDPFDVLLQQALMQIVRGSNHPQSVIGPHSLLEDMYGNADAVTGHLDSHDEVGDSREYQLLTNEWRYKGHDLMMLKLNGGVSYGWDKKPGRANFDDNGNGIIDDALEGIVGFGDDVFLGNTPAYPDPNKTLSNPAVANPPLVAGAPLIDNIDNYYAGRVITFISGQAAGQSCYILRSKIVGQQPGTTESPNVRTVLYVTPTENGTMPNGGDPSKPGGGDRYVINSRAFNGTGFGSTMPGSSDPNDSKYKRAGDLRLLSYMYDSPVDDGKYSLNGKNVPIALTPNPVDYGYRQYLKDMDVMVDADEDYDAYDYQNMIVTHRQGTGRVIAPSLHRPDLVNFFLNRTDMGVPTGLGRPLRWTDLPPSIRRRIILRPDPVDHYDYTQAGFLDPLQDTDGFSPGEPFTDQNGNNVYDPGEPYTDQNNNKYYDPSDRSFANAGFDAVNGPWDVDNDNDGIADSIWVDIGLPVTTTPDGRMVKPLVAIMVLDLDGRINVNAHGSPKHYTRTTELNDVVNAGDQLGGGWTMQEPKNRTNPHPRQTTEERYLVGAKALAYDQQDGDVNLNPIIDPLYTSGMFPDYLGNARWATSMEGYINVSSQTTLYDWHAMWSSLPRIYTNSGRLGVENREMGPWIEPAVGQGYSVADVNPGILLAMQSFAPSMGMTVVNSGGRQTPMVTDNRVNWYRQLLEGDNDAPMPLPGRYGEAHLRRAQTGSTYDSYPGLGIVPRAGSTYFPNTSSSFYTNTRPTKATDDNVPGIPNAQTVLGNNRREEFNNGVQGDYATPGDFDSNGAVGLDLAGQPLYVQMGSSGETVDDPTEINLHRRYFPVQRHNGPTNQGDRGFFSYQDAQYTPAEFERVIRQREPSSATLSDRLWDMTNTYYYNDFERHTLTTEQWDLPCPHVAPTPELAGALRDLGLSLTHPSIGDLLRARFFLTDRARVNADKSARLATLAMRSFAIATPNPPPSQMQFFLKRKQTRLLSPDLGIGVRMDVNAPFGNGNDDNGNGVVDEPSEWSQEYVQYGSNLAFDGDRDGNYTNSVTATNAPLVTEQPRQQYAKELYCLMMLLIDENYVTPLPTAFLPGTGPGTGATEVLPPAPAPTGSDTLPTKYQANLTAYAQHWLTARRIAQWAINAADFRDRDSIMSSFEFDVDPFYDNDGDSFGGSGNFKTDNLYQPFSNGTWDVDGNVDVSTNANEDANKPWRGVVWGCEYADLLLTETLAFHDRRTQNHEDDNGVQTDPDGTTPITGTYKLTRARTDGSVILTDTGNMSLTKNYDVHWDQPRIPQGSAFIELFCTGNANNPIYPRELYNGNGALNLSKVVTDTAGNSYPVWRLPITQGRIQGKGITLTQNDVAARLAKNPASCSLDPADIGFSLLPWVNNVTTTNDRVTIERVVTFCDTAGSISSTAGLNMTSTTSAANVPGIDVYSNYSGNPVLAQPADYVVVGPYRNNVGSGNNGLDNVTPIGRTTATGITIVSGTADIQQNNNIRPQPVISLHSSGFIATSPDGSDQYPVYGGSPTASLGNAVYVNSAAPATPGYRQIRPPVTVACRTTGTLGGDSTGRAVGLNISEPTNVDRPSVYKLNNNPAITLTLRTTTYVKNGVLNANDRLYAPDPDDPGSEGMVDDLPWDGYMLENARSAVDAQSVITNTQLPRIDDHTTLRYKNVFLQRLADPLRPWHRHTNPYITLDWMPFDLTVMNAEPWSTELERLEHLREPGNIRRRSNNTALNDQDYRADGPLASVRVRFGSRQRGAPRYPFKGNFSYCNLWGQPNYLNPVDPNNPALSDPGGPPLDQDTRPPLTMRVSDKSGVTNANNYYGMTPYDYISPSATADPPTNEFNNKWQDPLIHTLGYINESYHYRRRFIYGNPSNSPTTIGYLNDPQYFVADPTIRPASRNAPDPNATYGWLMERDFISQSDPVSDQQYLKYIGAPWRPFNWMTWNNRPYAAAAELMLVPASSPSRLCYEFDMRRTALPADGDNATGNKVPWENTRSANHYLPQVAVNDVPGYVNRAPYGHLLNFFESSTAGSAPNPPEASVTVNGTPGYTPSNFYRILEFLHVPSRFSGTRHAHAHTALNQGSTYGPNIPESPGWPFTAPFNSYPVFREPGRVNINTMPHYADGTGGDPSQVWRSVINNFFPTRRYQRPTIPARLDIVDDDIRYSVDRVGYQRASTLLSGGAGNSDYVAPWNPSVDNRGSYHNLIASMQSDHDTYDPRGADKLGGNGGDRYYGTMTNRHDPSRPALFSNPFRSYLEGFTTLPVVPSLIYSANSSDPFLAVDATLLRRRDMTWQPWNLVPRNGAPSVTASSFLGTLNGNQNLDPAFDPLFALNFPRPYRTGYDSRAFSGYTGNMLYRWGTTANVAGVTTGYQNTMLKAGDNYRGTSINGTVAGMMDNFHSRDTDYRNTDRNPFFRYQLYTKLSNVATTRSNCYAIWVTLGYFEVERIKVVGPYNKSLPSQESADFASGDDLPDIHRYPSGYRILRELGSETGEVKRHKAFALFDRTIPVGFVRGENLNVDRAFLTRRILY